MAEITLGVDWLAVIVGAVAAFLLGWLWYSPMLFGEKWAEGSGVKMGDASDMPWEAMASQALGLFLMSWFVGVMARGEVLFTVLLATVAFTVMAFSGAAFSGKSRYARFVDAGYWIAALVIMVLCQGIFRGAL